MSFCKEEGKDKVIFVTKEDHDKPSTTQLEDYYEGEPGLILDNGDINWNCPCLGGMATGPCGYEFRAAFTCFHNSTADPKGSDCYEEFKGMQDCMVKHPTVYDTADKDDEEVDVFGAETEQKEETSEVDSKSESLDFNTNNLNDNDTTSSVSKQGR